METINISTDKTAGASPALEIPAFATAFALGDDARSSTPLFVPRDQAYYWTIAWQLGEAESLREIAEGKARRFTSGAAAAEWLLTDDES